MHEYVIVKSVRQRLLSVFLSVLALVLVVFGAALLTRPNTPSDLLQSDLEGQVSDSKDGTAVAEIDTVAVQDRILIASAAEKIDRAPADFKVSSKLNSDLSRATDWRKFALDALRRPEEGGYYYAMYVANVCARDQEIIRRLASESIGSVVGKSGSIGFDTLARVEGYRQLCSSFAPGEAKEVFGQAKRMSADLRDPLVRLTSGLRDALASNNSEGIRFYGGKLLMTRDSVALGADRLLEMLMMGSSRSKSGGGYWFDGREVDPLSSDEFSAIPFGVQLALCRDGFYCALDDQMMLACVSGGECHSRRLDYIASLLEVDDSSRRQLQRIEDVSRRMREALNSGNVGAFIQ